MTTTFTIIVVYFLVIIGIGFISRTRAMKSAEDYFVAGRTLGTFAVTMGIPATLFSAFVFIALPGLVYKTGAGFLAGLPIANFLWTAMIFLVGYKIWLAGKKFGFITPTELFRRRFNSDWVAIIVFITMVIFVSPYLALQPMGGGYLLAAITKGTIPYAVGAGLITVVLIIYAVAGGLRGVAWVDAFQGVVFLFITILTLVFVAIAVGGLRTGSARIMAEVPALFSPSGPVKLWSWTMCFSWLIFVFLNIMFQPAIFARYYAGRNVKTLRWSFAMWPIFPFIMLIIPVFIALYGRVLMPNLDKPDSLVPLLWVKFTPIWFIGLGAAGMLSALMSTASSQLMVLTSMWTRDIYVPYVNRDANESNQVLVGRLVLIILAALGFAIAFKPPRLMGMLAGASFSAIAILAPAGIAAFYWRRATAPAVIASIIVGEIPVVFTYFGWIPKKVWLGFDASIPGLIIATVLLVLISYVTKPPPKEAVDAFISTDMDIFKFIREKQVGA